MSGIFVTSWDSFFETIDYHLNLQQEGKEGIVNQIFQQKNS